MTTTTLTTIKCDDNDDDLDDDDDDNNNNNKLTNLGCLGLAQYAAHMHIACHALMSGFALLWLLCFGFLAPPLLSNAQFQIVCCLVVRVTLLVVANAMVRFVALDHPDYEKLLVHRLSQLKAPKVFPVVCQIPKKQLTPTKVTNQKQT